MDSVGKYQIVHPDGTRLSPVDMATLAEMVYAGIVQSETELFAVATSRTIKAGEIPYLAFLISRLKESPSAPPPRLPAAEPARQTPPARTPRPVRSEPPTQIQPQESEPTIQEILRASAPITIPVAEPPTPPVVAPEPEPEPELELEPIPEVAEPVIEVVQELPELPEIPELPIPVEPLPEPVTIPIALRPTWQTPLEPLAFETPLPEAPVLEEASPIELAEVIEAAEIPVLEILAPELVQAEPVRIEVAEEAAPTMAVLGVPEQPEPEEVMAAVEAPALPVLPEPEPLEISLEIQATAAPPPLPVEAIEAPVETISEPAPAEADTTEVPTVSEQEPAAAAPPRADPPKADPPPAKAPPEPTPDVPDKRSGRPSRPKPLSAQQKRNYTVTGVVGLVCVVGFFAWQQTVGAAAQRDRQAIVGAWEQADGSSVVFKEDGSGAMTRPDPIYGNRTHLFRWERHGALIHLTEKRILMPGGTRQTAADSQEPVGLSPDGLLLHFSDMDLAKVP